ncbi:MAG: hypothetical protein IJX92_04250 [Clostridia bacterium]|nr:hypothetical protein [Clostridia bacterium]
MSTKNALLFFLAVFGIIFIGVDACLPLWGLGNLQGAMSYIGGLMLVVFLILVLGFGFVFRVAYILGSCWVVGMAFTTLFMTGDLVMGLVYAGVSVVLLALIPTVFLKKK